MKRRVRFREDKDDADEIPNSRMRKDDGEYVMANLNSEPAALSSADFEKKHTLDSDEEDEPDKYQRFDAEKFEGQEDATEEYDGKIKIMAFNMKEDMEEGHFASDGTFIFDKKKDMIKDAWLDNINWDNVKNKAGELWQKNSEEPKEEAEDNKEEVNVEQIFGRLLELLPNATETVGAALKRLNSEKGLSAAEERKRRWAAKKAGVPFETGNSKTVSELTALSDSLISAGHMSAYQLTANDIRSRLAKIHQSKEAAAKEPEPFDMFADEEPTAAAASASTKSQPVGLEDNEPVVLWEFRVKDKEGNLLEKMHGPFNSDQIEGMREEQLLQHGGIVRKLGTDKFYDLKRIDFELYS